MHTRAHAHIHTGIRQYALKRKLAQERLDIDPMIIAHCALERFECPFQLMYASGQISRVRVLDRERETACVRV